MTESRVRQLVTGLEDRDFATRSAWPSTPVPAAGPGSARLSFDALAQLFAAQRPSLIDADLVTIDTIALVSARAPQGNHDE